MARTSALLLAILVVGATAGAVVLAAGTPPGTDPVGDAGPAGFETFDSAAEFNAYVQQANRQYGTHGGMFFDGERVMVADTAGVNALETTSVSTAVKSTPRHSSTNVQELGIGEPDLVKNDGEFAYYSPYGEYRHAPNEPAKGIHVLSISPPGSIGSVSQINDSGRLLRQNDTLVVLGDDAVVGYDVSDPDDPEQIWHHTLDGHVAGARLMDGQVYMVVASGISEQPCPIEPLDGVRTPCTQVIRPSQPAPADATYTVTMLDATSGEAAATRSFVGPRDSVVYMSEDSLYVTLTRPTPRGELLTNFLLSEATAELPDHAVDRLQRVQGYNLTDRALYYEAQHVLESYMATLDEPERKQFNEELETKYERYTREHLRDFTTTQVMEFGATDLALEASGRVPGEPLNQWALDEQNETLRIATTVRAPRLRWGAANTSNDVYTLDEDLEIAGSVTGMSDGQEVFGVRFVGDTGYVITFRQVDPLHVLDLSDPANPEEKGELKLPGFSRYLHPLSGDRLLGIGEEDGHVKTVIFDVSDPTDPTIDESRVLNARWSAAVENHHAFLQDPRHEAFYIPTEYGGQVLSTEDLSTYHRVGVIEPKRAIYVGDHLYVFGRSEVAVVDEQSWERVDSLRLGSAQD